MAAIGITGMGLTGVVRMTWVQDDLAHVPEHARTDETAGTWPGLLRVRPGAGQRCGRRGVAAPGRRGARSPI